MSNYLIFHIMTKRKPLEPTHNVQINIEPLHFSSEANKYYGMVQPTTYLSTDDICRLTALRGGSMFSTEQIKLCVNEFLAEMAYQLSNGASVNTGYFTAEPTVKGTFNSSHQNFNPNDHSVSFNFRQGSELIPYANNAKVEVVNSTKDKLIFDYVYDYSSDSTNKLITANKLLLLKGNKLKVTGNDASVGVYFINHDTHETFKVHNNDIIKNNPKSLLLLAPPLTKGKYSINIVTQNNWGSKNNNSTKTIRYINSNLIVE